MLSVVAEGLRARDTEPMSAYYEALLFLRGLLALDKGALCATAWLAFSDCQHCAGSNPHQKDWYKQVYSALSRALDYFPALMHEIAVRASI